MKTSWAQLQKGMSASEFLAVMPFEFQPGVPFKLPRTEVELEAAGNVISRKTIYEYPPFMTFTFFDDKLKNEQSVDQCIYTSDESGAFEMLFPVDKARAKALFYNAARPLGYEVNPRAIPDAEQYLSRTAKRYYPITNLEAILQVKFTEQNDGTLVYVNTESTEIVWKSRDVSYAKSILDHMSCSLSLSSVTGNRAEKKHQIPAGAKDKPLTLQLLNQDTHSFVDSLNGESVEFLVAEDVLFDNQIVISAGAVVVGRLGGEFSEEQEPILKVTLDKVEAVDGKWYSLTTGHRNQKLTIELVFEKIAPPPGKTVIWNRRDMFLPIGWHFHVTVELKESVQLPR
ncbi:MAG: hypothetical protein GY792_14350 [Gammaproteobacteria bacterium]|nr:hypothetical protein [Gammaproteobacteria bacterium]